MKILYLHQYFNTPKMTGGTRSYEMARRFVKAGHEVHMITSWRERTGKSSGWSKEVIEGITVHWFSVPYSNQMNYNSRIKAFIYFAISAGIKAVSLEGDIVFATSTPLTIALPGIFASKRLKIPMVFEVRDLWPELPIAVGALKNPVIIKAAKYLERIAYRYSNHIIALSPGMAEGIAKTGYPNNKISVIPNSCDIDFFQVPESAGNRFLEKYPELAGCPMVVYAGTLGLINGVGYFAEIAYAMLKINPSVRFLIAGDGKEFGAIEEKARQLGVLGTNMWMIPPVPKSTMPDLLSAAAVSTSFFIDLPEMWNNSANKFFDSLAAGCPVMINYQGWQADILQKNGAGIIVPPGNAMQAAEILNNFLKDSKRLNTAKCEAFRLAKNQFSRDYLSKKLLSVLESIDMYCNK
ncbi:Glycosyltransferase family I N-terminal domain-containing protein [Desulfonema limicola]|uniref:Glycosyltransferase family I N-terminal domain-containing protein n=1 Tax=Desulfonema limicola TaxID=45656 RepID=A0A975BDB5_9BACT|nr:glycosyltransferase family 4 protein [Desulfonema limicola]QTA83252.1 Glycosyltransferase family I N-terminal domain-containing protein [Desulfonema limicola]